MNTQTTTYKFYKFKKTMYILLIAFKQHKLLVLSTNQPNRMFTKKMAILSNHFFFTKILKWLILRKKISDIHEVCQVQATFSIKSNFTNAAVVPLNDHLNVKKTWDKSIVNQTNNS